MYRHFGVWIFFFFLFSFEIEIISALPPILNSFQCQSKSTISWDCLFCSPVYHHVGHRSDDIQHLCTSVMVEGTWTWLCPESAATISAWHDGWLHICLSHRLCRRFPVPRGHPQCCTNPAICKSHFYILSDIESSLVISYICNLVGNASYKDTENINNRNSSSHEVINDP